MTTPKREKLSKDILIKRIFNKDVARGNEYDSHFNLGGGHKLNDYF